jgi:integrase
MSGDFVAPVLSLSIRSEAAMAAKGAKLIINAKKLDSLAKAAEAWPEGERQMLHDNASPGGAVRVYAGGTVALGMVARFPLHPKNPVFRAIDSYVDAASLVPWREKVREWRGLIDRGIDPKLEVARQRAVEKKKQIQTLAALWDEFEKEHVAKLVKADEGRRAGEWWKSQFRDRIAAEIEPWEIGQAISKLKDRTPAEARNRLGHLGGMYSWAIGTGGWGIKSNPVGELNPTKLIGAKTRRHRVLSDEELRLVWTSCNGPVGVESLKEARRRDAKPDARAPLAYPYGPVFRLMILTGQRENEVAGMRWSEIDLRKKLWTIPVERMKMKRAHEVPLAPMALEILKSMPRFAGDCVFSTDGGKKPINGFSKSKARLDHASSTADWVLHDLRRTARTHFSPLKGVEDLVKELVIAHVPPEMQAVYDQHKYRDEKRHCLTLWEQAFANILNPAARR